MTDAIKEFINAQAFERAKAARSLSSELNINGVFISSGCDEKGILVMFGLDKLAKITGHKITYSPEDRNGRCLRYIIIEGTCFYEYSSNKSVEEKENV